MNRTITTVAVLALAALSLTGCTRTVYVKATPTPTAATAAPAAAADPEPTTEDFKYEDAFPTITLKVTHKACFGSAGCNVTVKPELAVLDPDVVPDDATGTITYEIHGGSDGTVIDTMTLTGSQYEASSEVVSTASSGAKLTVKITDTETDPQ